MRARPRGRRAATVLRSGDTIRAQDLAASLPLRKEGDIQAAILGLLARVPGVTAWRNNTGAVAIPATPTRKRRFVRFSVPGISDIIGFVEPNARFLAIEAKRPGQTLAPNQRAFLERVQRANGIGIAAWSTEDVVREFRALGLL
jgi:hypothetical protein